MSDDAAAPQAEQLSRRAAHDLKNIFSTVKANVELIMEGGDADPLDQRRLHRILDACEQGRQLIDALRGNEQHPAVQTGKSPERAAAASASGCVLVVDDEKDVVEIVVRYLRKTGLTVHGCTRGQEALELLQQQDPAIDLLITDLTMPDISGIDLIQRITELRPDLPVIVITGYDRTSGQDQVLAENVCEWVYKPLDRAALTATVLKHLPSGSGAGDERNR